MSLILSDNCDIYASKMRLASLPKFSRAGNFLLPWFGFIFQIIYLTISKLQTTYVSTIFFLLSVIGTEILPMATSFLEQVLSNYYFNDQLDYS